MVECIDRIQWAIQSVDYMRIQIEREREREVHKNEGKNISNSHSCNLFSFTPFFSVVHTLQHVSLYIYLCVCVFFETKKRKSDHIKRILIYAFSVHVKQKKEVEEKEEEVFRISYFSAMNIW